MLDIRVLSSNSAGGCGNLERHDDRQHPPRVLVFGSVAPVADRSAAGEDRPFECASYGRDGKVLLPVVVWYQV